MSISCIQGLSLEVTVVGCYNLDDKEWISRQDPYVSLEYGGTKFRTKTCTDGGKNPIFQEKFIFTLVEGLGELNVLVWNSRTITADEFIGSGRIQLQKVLSQGYDDASWSLQSRNGRHSGEVRLILHFPNCNQNTAITYPAATPYPSPSPYTGYPPNPAAYPPSPYSFVPPAGYPTQPCPPAGYPVQSPFPGLHQASTYYPTGSSGVYPPPAVPPSSGIYPPPPGIYPPPPY